MKTAKLGKKRVCTSSLEAVFRRFHVEAHRKGIRECDVQGHQFTFSENSRSDWTEEEMEHFFIRGRHWMLQVEHRIKATQTMQLFNFVAY